MNTIDVLEELANSPSLEDKVEEIIKKNPFIESAFETNNMYNLKKILSSCEYYANEVSVVRN